MDRDGGFEKATLIYDRDGRLIAVDYQMPEREPQDGLKGRAEGAG